MDNALIRFMEIRYIFYKQVVSDIMCLMHVAQSWWCFNVISRD